MFPVYRLKSLTCEETHPRVLALIILPLYIDSKHRTACCPSAKIQSILTSMLPSKVPTNCFNYRHFLIAQENVFPYRSNMHYIFPLSLMWSNASLIFFIPPACVMCDLCKYIYFLTSSKKHII